MSKKWNIWAAMAAGCLVLSGCSLFTFHQEEHQPGETTASVVETQPEETTIQAFPEESERETETLAEVSTESTEEESGGESENGTDEIRTDKLMIATDIHYFSPELTDYREEFYRMVNHGDGKMVPYISQITDAFVEQVLEEQPDIVVLSGDLSLNGEKLSHQALAEKLYKIEEAGIPVAVIPGNHDINNPRACGYERNGTYPASPTSPEEFLQIYEDFGYNEAVSRDSTSLSYLYQLNERTRLLMLDSCQYKNGSKVGGMIQSGTYDWIQMVLEDSWNAGMNVIPVAHHNLLDQSQIYVLDCTIEHSEELLEVLSGWGINIFLSGHLHVQHNKELGGVYEIVTSSLATPWCRYGILNYGEDTSFDYETRSLDMKAWAERNGSRAVDLRKFDTYGERFLKKVFYNQAYGETSSLPMSEAKKKQMAEFYAMLKFYYYQGNVVEIRETMEQDPAMELWSNEGAAGELYELIVYMLADGIKDYNQLHIQ